MLKTVRNARRSTAHPVSGLTKIPLSEKSESEMLSTLTADSPELRPGGATSWRT